MPSALHAAPLDANGKFDFARAPHRIGAVTLVVRDLAAAGQFYRRAIGLSVIETGAGFERLGVAGKVLVDLRHEPGARPASRRDAGLFHTAFLVPRREDLGAWLRFASESGLPMQGAADHLVSEALYLADPEGNGIEVYWDRPVVDWRIRDGAIAMATDPLDAEGLIRSGAGRAWTGFPAGGTIGHVHLQVGATSSADSFYQTLLGFDISCRYPGASFYGSGGYHHQLAGNIWNSRGASARQPGTAGLVAIELLTPDSAVLSATRERIAAAGHAHSGAANVLEIRDPWGLAISLKMDAG
jgi:catechol 2,3-dioxygenase